MVSEQKVQCYGVIPLCFEAKGVEALLVQHVKGEYWGFPKGHPEAGESDQQTAERELFEETGLKIERYLPYPPLIEKYHYLGKGGCPIFKKVTFYLATVSSNLQFNKEEIIQGKWFPLKELFKTSTFPCQKKLYKELIDLLT